MRSKAGVLQEHYGVQDHSEVGKLYGNDHIYGRPRLPSSLYTKLELPYEAPNHPDIPTFEEIEEGVRKSAVSPTKVTEYIEGEVVDYRTWLGYSDELLRAIPSEGYFGRVHYQGWRPSLEGMHLRLKEMRGPFNSYEEYVSAMYKTAELDGARSYSSDEWGSHAQHYLSIFKPFLLSVHDWQPKFTHANLRWANIIVQPPQGTGESASDWEVTFTN
ncbi:hypothetical protein GQ44DRAFT_726956 [Phaeosphaeriaceae sp. PMI808]|nr:hypothetical protein GQ44DRAFT_726956 [Phaeosphaeriaceae sp. PMI808]